MDFPLIFIFNEEKVSPLYLQIITAFLVVLVLFIFFYQIISYSESLWVRYISPKPFYLYLYIKKKKLTVDQLYILETDFSFYQNLKSKQKIYFQHRVAKFMELHQFKGRSGMFVNDKMKILISSTAIMLTFGYRDYMINSLSRFIIYPDVFRSKINKANHKGEFNPAYKAIVFSWKDFMEGYNINNDNFNLGIHEIVHAMYFDFRKPNNDSISAIIFMHYYKKILKLMQTDTNYRERLLKSEYIRNYAFTNNFEFIAVLIESFFETPQEFKSQFPEIYNYVKQMLNFDLYAY